MSTSATTTTTSNTTSTSTGIEHYPAPLVLSHQIRPLVFISVQHHHDAEDNEEDQDAASTTTTTTTTPQQQDLKLESDLYHNLMETRLVNLRLCGTARANATQQHQHDKDRNSPAIQQESQSTADTENHPLATQDSPPTNSKSPLPPYSMPTLKIPHAPTQKSYTNYKPKGILPRAWLHKVTETVPAVVVLATVVRHNEDIDWILERVRTVKESGRFTRTIVLLHRLDSDLSSEATTTTTSDTNSTDMHTTQDTTSSDGGTMVELEPTINDKIKELKGELESKYIFTLNNTSGSRGLSSMGFSRTVYDASVLYYKDNVDRLKKFKKQISLSAQPYMHTRHRFKMGFYEEILANRNKSYKYYSEAYHSLMNVTQYSEREIKILADYINFKLCQLKLREKKVDAAVKQFSRHIRWFNSKRSEGLKKIYEHYYLLYRQYRMFAVLLESPSSGFDLRRQKDSFGVNRNRNPAFYYHAAAEAAKERRYHMERLCAQHVDTVRRFYQLDGTDEEKLKITTQQQQDEDVQDEDSTSRSSSATKTLPHNLQVDEEITSTEGYVGQEISYLTPEEQHLLEETGIPNLRQIARELIFDHSDTIQRMLTRVYTICIRYGDKKVSRFIFSIVYNLALEFERTQQWMRAYNFFKRVAAFYKEEMWYDLLSDTLQHALNCAREEAHPRELIPVMLPLLSSELNASEQEKEYLWQEFTQYFAAQPAEENDDNKDSSRSIASMPRFTSPLLIEYGPKDMLFQVKTHFSSMRVEVQSPTTLSLCLHSTCMFPIQASRLQVLFSDEQYNLVLNHGDQLSNGNDIDLNMKPGNNFLHIPMTFKEKQDLVIFSIVLHIGHHPHSLCIRWNYQRDHAEYIRQIKYRASNEIHYESSETFLHRPAIRVVAPQPKLSFHFEHVPPAMVNEFYCLRVRLYSNEDSIEKGSLTLSPMSNVYVYNEDMKEVNTVEFGAIKPGEFTELVVYVRFMHQQTSVLKFVANYETPIYSQYATEAEFSLSSVHPFTLTHKLHATRPSRDDTFMLTAAERDEKSSVPKYIPAFRTGAPLVLSSTFKCITNYPVILKRVSFRPASQIDSTQFQCLSANELRFTAHNIVQGASQEEESKETAPLILGSKDEYSLVHVLQADPLPKSATQMVNAGMFDIVCQRHVPAGSKDKSPSREFNYVVCLPDVAVFNPAVSADVDIPAEACVNEVFDARITLHNNSTSVQIVDLHMEDSPHFIMSGVSKVQRELAPFESLDFHYKFSPLITGFVTLPKFTMYSGKARVSFFNSSEEWRVFVRDI